MTKAGTLLLLLTAIVAALAGILAFAVSKFFAAARTATRAAREGGAETAFMAAAMEEALQKMRKQERAMQARAEASERLSGEIIASLTSGLLVVSQEGIIRTLNPAGQQLLGLPNSELMRDYREELAGSSPLADVIQECLVARRPIVRRAVRMDRPGSGASHLGITVSPIRDESGHEHGAICLFTDLSEIADLEDQLRLKDSLARLGELTAGIAHEFRNGLATIHGYSRLLDLERLPADFKPYVQGIRQETEELGQVVTNFLNFAKPAELVLAPVDVGILAEKAAEEIRPEATARGGEVVVKGHFGVVEGDEVLLRQAFSNLCRNALEACAGSPRIVVEGGNEGPATLRVSVTDNGPGVDPALAERIFRPFFTTKARGTGLGLALVQKIIVTHNGRVSAANAEGGGACLTVTLPLRTA
ncbi:MAG TPA: ATP-binding protein [Vicinamibacterales bacterium]|jgi:PAS domain S-box-containing protein|nr:ATP-binding protein [Vicinamibacterales bacterium]